ncbi:MAG: alpha/beta hydrolase, partial [Bacteroidota bacterium]
MNPDSADESMVTYMDRLKDVYSIDKDPNVVFIGHSLGGILAQELASHMDDVPVILISSVKGPDELPWHIRSLRHGYAYHLASKSFIKRTIPLWGGYHGYENQEVKDLLIDEVETLDNTYFIWAYKQAIYWEGALKNTVIQHLHGTVDRTFPIRNISDYTPIRGGDHLMVYKHGEILSEHIRQCL